MKKLDELLDLLRKDDVVASNRIANRIVFSNNKNTKLSVFLAENGSSEIILVFNYFVIEEDSWTRGELIVNTSEFIADYESTKTGLEEVLIPVNTNYTDVYEMVNAVINNNNLITDRYFFPRLNDF